MKEPGSFGNDWINGELFRFDHFVWDTRNGCVDSILEANKLAPRIEVRMFKGYPKKTKRWFIL